MQLSGSVLCVLNLSFITAYSYQLNFHKDSGSLCASETLGSWSGNIKSGCRQIYAGAAHDITITPDDNESASIVAFYSSDDCNPEHLIKKHHTGCSAPIYRSFQVVDRAAHFKVDRPTSARSSPGSDSARQVRHRGQNELAVTHGDTFEHNGVTRRWHQLAKGTFTGVLAREWDDDIHQANEDELDIQSDMDSMIQSEVEDDMEPFLIGRDLEDGRCMTTVRCASDLAKRGYGGLKKYGPVLLEHAVSAANGTGKPLWEFLNQPFISSLTGGPVGLASTVGAMFINNKYEPGLQKDEAAQCMTENTAKALIEAINRQIVALDKNTAAHQTRVESDSGQIADVSVAVDEDGNKPIDCGVTGD
jgi:hypothetical protein